MTAPDATPEPAVVETPPPPPDFSSTSPVPKEKIDPEIRDRALREFHERVDAKAEKRGEHVIAANGTWVDPRTGKSYTVGLNMNQQNPKRALRKQLGNMSGRQWRKLRKRINQARKAAE